MIDYRRPRRHVCWTDLALLIASLVLIALMIGFGSDGPSSSAPAVDRRAGAADLQRAYWSGFEAGRASALRTAGWPAGRGESVR